MQIELEAKIDVFSKRVLRTTGGSVKSGKGTKKKLTFAANKVWRFRESTEYLVGWNVLVLYKSKGELRCKHPRLLTSRQLDDIDALLLPRIDPKT